MTQHTFQKISALCLATGPILFTLGDLVRRLVEPSGTPSAAAITSAVTDHSGAWLLAGFASLHFRTRGKPWRLFALWFAYLSVLLFTIPIFAILVLGLMDTRRTIALTPTGPAEKKNQNI